MVSLNPAVKKVNTRGRLKKYLTATQADYDDEYNQSTLGLGKVELSGFFLHKARKKLKMIIYLFSKAYNLKLLRRYSRKEYLSLQRVFFDIFAVVESCQIC